MVPQGSAGFVSAASDALIELASHLQQVLGTIGEFMGLLSTNPEFREEVGTQMVAFFQERYQKLKDGDGFQKGEVAGELFTEIVLLLAPGGALTKSSRGARLAAGLTSRMPSIFGKVAHASEAPRVAAKNLGKIGTDTVKIHMKDGRLLPNVRYQAGEFDYFYETDHLGRLNKFETDKLQLTERTERLKHNPDTPGKLSDDHSGHLAGDRFGGSPELDNLVSQASKVNVSDYRILENKWAKAIESGKNVKVEVKILYKDSDMRPSGFDIRYSIDGKPFSTKISNNI